MEILRVFINLLEGLSNLGPVFFILQNFLPRRPLRHRVEFKHFVDEYPA